MMDSMWQVHLLSCGMHSKPLQPYTLRNLGHNNISMAPYAAKLCLPDSSCCLVAQALRRPTQPQRGPVLISARCLNAHCVQEGFRPMVTFLESPCLWCLVCMLYRVLMLSAAERHQLTPVTHTRVWVAMITPITGRCKVESQSTDTVEDLTRTPCTVLSADSDIHTFDATHSISGHSRCGQLSVSRILDFRHV